MEYTNKGEFLIPNLTIEEAPKKPLGRFGRMRKNYLKEHQSGLYQGLLLSGKLTEHLLEIDQTADGRMELLVKQMADSEGVNEKLKAEDQMLWVQRMENIQNRAEEIIMTELVYS
ncbi:MAG: TnpV protein [Clostridiales bacterium]|nr:TnpV protein [Clostridiales bacterium]MCD8150118.1 TnpV protein [Clostridiales bacterium]